MLIFLLLLTCAALTIAAVVAIGVWRVNAHTDTADLVYRPLSSLMLVSGTLVICQATAWILFGILIALVTA